MNTSLWSKLAEKRREGLRKIFDDPKYEKIFDKDFFASIEQKKADAAAQGKKVQIFQGSILLLLMFALFVPDAHVSFLGLGGEVRYLREALLIIASTVQSLRWYDLDREAQLREVLEVYARKVAQGDERVLEPVRLKLGLGLKQMFPTIDVKEFTPKNIALFLTMGVSLFIWIILGIFGALLIQFATLVSILLHPSISLTVSVLVTIYVVAVDVMIHGLQIIGQTVTPFDNPLLQKPKDDK